MEDYKALALQQLNPALNQKIQALKNAALNSKQSLDQSKGSINTNFDQQNEDQNMQNSINKNNISNSALGRGLGRSSIVTSGLGEADMVNTKYLDRLKSARTGALNNIEQQKSLLDTNTESSIAQMNMDSQNEALALARQLEDRDWDKNFKQKEFDTQVQTNNDRFAWEKQMQQADQAFKERQFNAEQAYKAQQLAAAKSNALNKSMSVGSAYNKEVANINDLVNGKYNLSEKQRVLESYVSDLGSQQGTEAQALAQYAKEALGKVNNQMSDFVNSGRYAGYENRRY